MAKGEEELTLDKFETLIFYAYYELFEIKLNLEMFRNYGSHISSELIL